MKYTRPGKVDGKRPCHDCGRMQYDYRCPSCWRKIRGNVDLYENQYTPTGTTAPRMYTPSNASWRENRT